MWYPGSSGYGSEEEDEEEATAVRRKLSSTALIRQRTYSEAKQQQQQQQRLRNSAQLVSSTGSVPSTAAGVGGAAAGGDRPGSADGSPAAAAVSPSSPSLFSSSSSSSSSAVPSSPSALRQQLQQQSPTPPPPLVLRDLESGLPLVASPSPVRTSGGAPLFDHLLHHHSSSSSPSSPSSSSAASAAMQRLPQRPGSASSAAVPIAAAPPRGIDADALPVSQTPPPRHFGLREAFSEISRAHAVSAAAGSTLELNLLAGRPPLVPVALVDGEVREMPATGPSAAAAASNPGGNGGSSSGSLTMTMTSRTALSAGSGATPPPVQPPPSPTSSARAAAAAAERSQQRPPETLCGWLALHSCHSIVPQSSKLVVLDTALAVKSAFYALEENAVKSAPIWDSTKHDYVGIITISDFIEILLHFHQRVPRITNILAELEKHQIRTWRTIIAAEGRGVTRLAKLHWIDPSDTLYEASLTLMRHHIHRLPIIDRQESNTILHILTHYIILSFIYEKLGTQLRDHLPVFRQTLQELGLGTYRNVATATPDTPLHRVLELFAQSKISAVPIVDPVTGVVLDIYSKSDVGALVQEIRVDFLDRPVGDFLEYKKFARYEPLQTCLASETTLFRSLELLIESQTHRLVLTDESGRLAGLLSEGDVLRFILLSNI